jgi:hypothetical protein
MAFSKYEKAILCISIGFILKRRRSIASSSEFPLQRLTCMKKQFAQMQLFKNQISVFHIATALCS